MIIWTCFCLASSLPSLMSNFSIPWNYNHSGAGCLRSSLRAYWYVNQLEWSSCSIEWSLSNWDHFPGLRWRSRPNEKSEESYWQRSRHIGWPQIYRSRPKISSWGQLVLILGIHELMNDRNLTRGKNLAYTKILFQEEDETREESREAMADDKCAPSVTS